MSSSTVIEDLRHDLKAFIPALVNSCTVLSNVIAAGETDSSVLNQLEETLNGCNQLYMAMDTVIADAGHENDPDLRLLGTSLKKEKALFEKAFYIFNKSMDDEDYLHASDILRYEFIPLFYSISLVFEEGPFSLKDRFAANLEYLKQNFKGVYDEVIEVDPNNPQYCIEYSRNKMPNLKVDNDGFPVLFYSTYDPKYEADQWVHSLQIEGVENSSIFMFGFGFGYHALSVSQKHKDKKLYLYEPDLHVFIEAMKVINIPDLFNRMNVADLVVGTRKESRDQLFYRMCRYAVGESDFVSLPVYNRFLHINAKEIIDDAGISILNYKSAILMNEAYGIDWAQNCLFNLPTTLTTPSVKELKNKLSGMTAIIAGAGPSLEADMEWIGKMREHAVIIAAGTAFQSLLHFGVKPHLIVSIDGSEANHEAFKLRNINDIPLLFAPMVHHTVVDGGYSTNLIHMHLNNDYITKYFAELNGDEPIFKSSLSVTGAAIQAAIYMGCSDVVLAGQDLSYPTNNVYSAGAAHITDDFSQTTITNADLVVENVNGTMNRTNLMMKLTLQDIEELLEAFPETTFLNTSSLGAKIKHTEFIQLKELYIKYKQATVDGELFINFLNSFKTDRLRLNLAIKKISALPQEVQLVEHNLLEIKTLIDELSERGISHSRTAKGFESLQLNWKHIFRTSLFKGLFLKISRNEIYNFERDLPRFIQEHDREEKVRLMNEIMRPILNDMLHKIPKIEQLITEAIERLKKVSYS
ncbi:motility associated factor glycosyltransferase family protein [Paenibacillus sp. GCM10027627]|uniref:motility associated factor glycosyltransferase family protein n=1 Tax=unclassified Paenibacillus TaxID=185978 RepID=UPI00362756E5